MTNSIRELLAELAQIEDAIRRVPAHVVQENDLPGARESRAAGLASVTPLNSPINPELVSLMAREDQVLRALHHLRGDPASEGRPVTGAGGLEAGSN